MLRIPNTSRLTKLLSGSRLGTTVLKLPRNVSNFLLNEDIWQFAEAEDNYDPNVIA